jgi:hypothetical protein
MVIGSQAHAGPRFGYFTVTYEGILVPSPQELTNSTGPITFRAFDLDAGAELNGSGAAADVFLTLNVIPLTFAGSARPSSNIADAGTASIGLERCKALMSGADGDRKISAQKVPTNYHCVRTTEGKTGIYRIRSVGVKYLPDSFATVTAVIEYYVWENPGVAGQMGSILRGVNFDQGDLYSRNVVTAEQCAKLCSDDDRCVATTFVISQNRCWIKSRLDGVAYSSDMASSLRKSRYK